MPAKKPAPKKRPAPKKPTLAGKAAKFPRDLAREALDAATAAIRELLQGAARNEWAAGQRLSHVARLNLFEARGYPSFDAYVRHALDLAPATAYKYMRVAEVFTEELCATFGVEKLDRAITFIGATPETEKPEDVPKLKIKVPAEDGGPGVEKSFAEVTVDELRRATQAARGAGGRPAQKLPAQLVKALVAANLSLDKVAGETLAPLALVGARRVGEQGEIVVDIRGVPIDRLAAALRGISSAFR